MSQQKSFLSNVLTIVFWLCIIGMIYDIITKPVRTAVILMYVSALAGIFYGIDIYFGWATADFVYLHWWIVTLIFFTWPIDNALDEHFEELRKDAPDIAEAWNNWEPKWERNKDGNSIVVPGLILFAVLFLVGACLG